ncbi:hypothetical protein CBOM_06494 [Ceraceosorus bombacis]|uniref:DUF7707 domain-containing protein n=1 Tax=Ceraceosorus bombacis TaxID=401625 RepID=A0A0P1BKE2_9BASI|nr:hypothetical protein CBOM_06494 [Ceraceosorus bombacis]
MQLSFALALVGAGAVAVSAQNLTTYSMLAPATTPRILSTDTAFTPPVTSSASGTIPTPQATVKSFDWSSAASAAATSAANRTASSNFTLPSATATAPWVANLVVQQSNPYVFQQLDTTDLPTLNWNLANETVINREAICAQQTKFCATAGCAEEGAVIKENFCDVQNLGTRCTCDKGATNLSQYKWPVQFADCLNRATACGDACALPGGTTAARTACKKACQSNFRETCGLPGQYSANYAVNKQGDKPNLKMIQGGSAGDSANAVRTSVATLFAAAAVVAVVLAA